MGGYGIVGGNLPSAAGLALASDYRGTTGDVCTFGAAPPTRATSARRSASPRSGGCPSCSWSRTTSMGWGRRSRPLGGHRPLPQGRGPRRPRERVDGQDVSAVRECVAEHVEIARQDRRPTRRRPSPTPTAATPRPTPRSTGQAGGGIVAARRTRRDLARRPLDAGRTPRITSKPSATARAARCRRRSSSPTVAQPPLEAAAIASMCSASRCAAGSRSTSVPRRVPRRARSARPERGRGQEAARGRRSLRGRRAATGAPHQATAPDRHAATGAARTTRTTPSLRAGRLGDDADAGGAQEALARRWTGTSVLHAWGRTSACSRVPSRSPRA